MAIRPASDAVAKEAAASIHQPRDPNTLANYNAWRTKHTKAEFEIDFEGMYTDGYDPASNFELGCHHRTGYRSSEILI